MEEGVAADQEDQSPWIPRGIPHSRPPVPPAPTEENIVISRHAPPGQRALNFRFLISLRG
jgi:hypothetical protein